MLPVLIQYSYTGSTFLDCVHQRSQRLKCSGKRAACKGVGAHLQLTYRTKYLICRIQNMHHAYTEASPKEAITARCHYQHASKCKSACVGKRGHMQKLHSKSCKCTSQSSCSAPLLHFTANPTFLKLTTAAYPTSLSCCFVFPHLTAPKEKCCFSNLPTSASS